jgi:hypothetical protein
LATKELAVASRQCIASHFLFHQGIFDKNNKTVVPHPPLSSDSAPCDFSLFFQLKIKLKCRHFDTNELIEGESQAALNTLIEHDFQDAFKNDRSAGKGANARKGTAWRAMVVSRPKVSF